MIGRSVLLFFFLLSEIFYIFAELLKYRKNNARFDKIQDIALDGVGTICTSAPLDVNDLFHGFLSCLAVEFAVLVPINWICAWPFTMAIQPSPRKA